MNLAQWKALHDRCAPGLGVDHEAVKGWLSSTEERDRFYLAVMMARAEYHCEDFQDYCDFIVENWGGYV